MTPEQMRDWLSEGCFRKPYDESKCYNTRCIKPDDYSWSDIRTIEKHCPYCGRKMNMYVNEKGEKFFNCDCEDAQTDHWLSEQIEKLYASYPKPKYRMKMNGSVYPTKNNYPYRY